MVDELGEWRRKIDRLDGKLLNILKKRFKLVERVGKYKHNKKLKIEDKKRENFVINSKLRKTKLSNDFVKKLFTLIMKESKKVQRRNK